MRKPLLIAESRPGLGALLAAAIAALALSTTCAMAAAHPANATAAKSSRGQVTTYDATSRRVALVLQMRRPVAMVPGLAYDPSTMIPRGICRAALAGGI